MLQKRVKLKDIAEKTGYSVNTVSLALKGERVGEGTRNLIADAAKELGYVGNAHASSLRSGLTKTIAIIVGDIANPYFTLIIKEAVNLLSTRHYSVIIYNTEEREDYEQNSIYSALRQNVDGILISPVVKDGDNVKLLKNTKVPLVIFGGVSRDPDICTVSLDDVKGGYLACKHLLDLGHRDIVFINGPDYVQSSMERLSGYRQALMEAGIDFDEKKVVNCDLKNERMVWDTVKYRLCHELSYTASIVYSDLLAMRLYSLLDSEDFTSTSLSVKSIVSFDNVLSSFPLPIKIASVGSKDIQMTIAATSLLMEQIEGRLREARKILLDVKVYAP